MTTAWREDMSAGRLFGQLARETGTLVRQEVELARTEMAAKGRHAASQAAFLAAGAALAHAALLALTAALVLGLHESIPLWASASIVGGVFAIASALLCSVGARGLARMNLAPTETMDSLREIATLGEPPQEKRKS